MADAPIAALPLTASEGPSAAACLPQHSAAPPPPEGAIVRRVHARIGLLGNPSDGFFGKTISLSLANYWAEVTLVPAEGVTFVPHPEHDGLAFASLGALVARLEGEGYYGGIRLLMAACKRFSEYCTAHGIALAVARRGFRLSYDTTIPRQAGLSGSSAIVCAALNCLLAHYGVEDRMPVVDRPALVLSAEAELGITAGLQDRVIQVYGGLVFMDFHRAFMEAHGRGRYESLDPALLPPLWLITAHNPSDSGKVHSDVKRRWLEGDPDVRARMAQVAQLAADGREALEARDYVALARLMDANFDHRRAMFGDAALGVTNLRMVAVARSVGAAAKFTGSGGAVVAFCPAGAEQERQLQAACAQAGFQAERVRVAQALHCCNV